MDNNFAKYVVIMSVIFIAILLLAPKAEAIVVGTHEEVEKIEKRLETKIEKQENTIRNLQNKMQRLNSQFQKQQATAGTGNLEVEVEELKDRQDSLEQRFEKLKDLVGRIFNAVYDLIKQIIR